MLRAFFARLRPWVPAAVAGLVAVLALWLAQQRPASAALPDAATREAVVAQVIRTRHERYVFPEQAARVEAALRSPQRQAEFTAAADGPAFAARLTEALQAATQDKHLRVMHSPAPVPEPRNDRPADEDLVRLQRTEEQRNFGVERVERLPGNIGYLELRGFARAEWAGEAIAAAMTLLARSDALIVDLRRNGGGDPATVALLASYLFDERTHLNDLYFRPENRTTQYWTSSWLPGRRFGAAKPVYVLTSNNTFSGAEEFSYNLKQLGRATIVGETTGGGAHPGELRKVGTHYRMFVSTGRAINPITKTNWEGTGVAPDIAVPAADALRVAQLKALAPLGERADDPALKAALNARIAELERAR